MSAGRRPVMSRPLKVMRPRVGDEEVGEQVEAGGLARAVRPDQRVDGPAAHPEVDVLDGDEAAELLGEPPRLQDDVVGHRAEPHAGRRRIEPRLAALVPGPVGLAPSPRRPCTRPGPASRPRSCSRGSRWNEAWSSRLAWPWRCARRGTPFRRSRASAASTPAGAHDPVDEAHGARLRRRHVVVEQRQLLGAPEADDAGQAEDRAVRDRPWRVAPRPSTASVGGEPEVAGRRELEPAADGVAVEHRDRQLVHVLEAVQRADPVPIERLVDPARPTARCGPCPSRTRGPAPAPPRPTPRRRAPPRSAASASSAVRAGRAR